MKTKSNSLIIKLFRMRKFLFTLVLLSFSIVFYAQDLYDLGVVKDIRLTFKQDNWAAILDHYKEDGKDKRLKATVNVCTVFVVILIAVANAANPNNKGPIDAAIAPKAIIISFVCCFLFEESE